MTPSISNSSSSCLPMESSVRAIRKMISIPYKRKQSMTLEMIKILDIGLVGLHHNKKNKKYPADMPDILN